MVATTLREALLTPSSLEIECNETVETQKSLATTNRNANTVTSTKSISKKSPNNGNSSPQQRNHSTRMELVNILQTKDRRRAARPAPPQGLIFAAALFDDDDCGDHDDDNSNED